MSETTDNSDMALRQQLTQGGYEVALLNERQRRIAAEEERDALVEKVANQDRAWTFAYEAGMQWRHRAEAAEARLAEIDAMRNERLDVVATITKQRDALAAELEAVKRVEAHLLADGRRSVTTEYTGGRLLIGYEVPAIPMHHEAAFDSYAEGDTLPALGRALAAQEGR